MVEELPSVSDEELARQRNDRALVYMARPDAAQLAEIAKLVDEGRVRPHVQSTFPLSEAASAQQSDGQAPRSGRRR